jgi:hypothetical protein
MDSRLHNVGGTRDSLEGEVAEGQGLSSSSGECGLAVVPWPGAYTARLCGLLLPFHFLWLS